jgi:thiol-disulfide isomerase/thioredoxin
LNQAIWILAGFVGIAGVQGDEPATTTANGRVVEGIVVAAGKPVADARVFFAEAERGFRFVEDATATTDAEGRYRADLARIPWATGSMLQLVLAPGFQVIKRKIEAGRGATTADFELIAQPWKETQIRLEDSSGRPVEGVEVTCSVGAVVWARLKTDAEGCCRLAMAPKMPIALAVKPKGARPIDTNLGVTQDEPASITLPVLPPIRGRVLDPDGRPVPDVAVGYQIGSGPDGEGKMWPFAGGVRAATDGEGRFEIAPHIYARSIRYLIDSKLSKPLALCFADPSFRRIAFRTCDPTRAIELMEVTLRPTRRVRVPIVRGAVVTPPQVRLTSSISIAPRADSPELRLGVISRILQPKEEADEWAVVEEYLPEGSYQLEIFVTGLTDLANVGGLGKASRELVVPSGEGTLDLPPLELETPDLLKLVGKPAPEFSATDLDTGKPVTLADFRGKVVVLELWGYWCGVCNNNMPHLVELHRKFAGRPLSIIALHDQSAQSRAEYERKTATTREHFWGGRDLPFRVLLDRPDPKKPDDVLAEGNGMTIRRYGAREFGSLLVIDQHGTLVARVGHWEHDHLESLVRELVEKAEGR